MGKKLSRLSSCLMLASSVINFIFYYSFHCSTSEADVEAVMDKLFDELAQKQNDCT